MRFVDRLKQYPDLVFSGGVDFDLIESAEKSLSLKFADEYKEYLFTFGTATCSGYEFTGIVHDQRINVVDVTTRLKPRATIPPNLYVVEEVHVDGLVIWQNEIGEVFQTLPSSEPLKIADSLADYIDT